MDPTRSNPKSNMESILRLPELHFDYLDNSPVDALFQQASPQFSAKTLATALSRNCDVDAIRSYIKRFPSEQVTRGLNTDFKQHKVIAYGVETDNTEIIKLLLEYKPNVNITVSARLPLLAFAILRARKTGYTNIETIRLLLSHGADPLVIPKMMWQNYAETPTIRAFVTSNERSSESESWCTPEFHLGLLEVLDLSTRYYLWRAHHMAKPHQRMLQIAAANNMTPLLKLPFQLVGQDSSVKLVVDTVYAHVAQNTDRPLVLAFAGLSGHGKTELARQMGSLLSVPITTLDCTHLNTVWSLLGADPGYIGNEEGAPLNNFLADHEGERCVVFLDEFEKTGQDIWNALLKVMDDGTYRDRRRKDDNNVVDCRKVIWILATNLGDKLISRYYDGNYAKGGEAGAMTSIEPLQAELEKLFVTNFSAAVTGRIDEIAPFWPFNEGEQAVIAHKVLREMQEEARGRIDEATKKLVGHSDINIIQDGKVCREIAKRSYNRELGARSIMHGLGRVRRDFILEYSKTDGLVSDKTNEEDRERYTIQVDPSKKGNSTIAVARDESTKNTQKTAIDLAARSRQNMRAKQSAGLSFTSEAPQRTVSSHYKGSRYASSGSDV